MGVQLKEFPRTFWVANVMELFERAAYYGLNSMLAVYLAASVADGGLGIPKSSVGFLQSIIYAATYVIPILGGALADRYGYRRMLIISFVLLSGGYFAAGNSPGFASVFAALGVMALGAGLFKPIISGTIARTTTEKTSAFGFGIYYWMINIGATIAPFVAIWLKGFSWRYIFFASAAYTVAMLPLAFFGYREPAKPANTKSLRETLLGAAEVLGDARFMLMVVVYSGFWILYFQNFGTVLYYLEQFVDRAPVDRSVNSVLAFFNIPWQFAFDPGHVTIINGGTIILLQVVVSWIVKELPALPTMMGGMFIGAIGFLLLALSQNPWVFIAGIAVFSIGEMTAHPKYYSFIGIVAPPDRKAVYMGYAFLYGVFGALLGSSVGSFFYESFLEPAKGTPEAASRAFWFWLAFAILDTVAAIGLWQFARRFGQDTPETRHKARIAMVGVYLLILVLGGTFLYFGLFAGEIVDPKKAVQATIFVLLGLGGLWISARRPATAS